jgi:hypothetical protein
MAIVLDQVAGAIEIYPICRTEANVLHWGLRFEQGSVLKATINLGRVRIVRI